MSNKSLLRNSFWLGRVVLLRYLAFIYIVAFTVALFQNEALLGNKGLTPSINFLNRVAPHYGNTAYDRFWKLPTLFWFTEASNENLSLFAGLGIGISSFIFVSGSANSIFMFTLWLLYMSIVNVGQTWYGFGWESLLLEAGFLAIFAVPMFELCTYPKAFPMPMLVRWGYRWLIFRLMLGAGLIKIRGDACWRDLTCMNYHYYTQPVPNPLSPHLHSLPPSMHAFETATNHVVELLGPWLLLLPTSRVIVFRWLSITGGIVQILFQIALISSGNLSFLNWLSILPCLACFDDEFLVYLSSLVSKKWSEDMTIRISALISESNEYNDKLLLSFHNEDNRNRQYSLVLLTLGMLRRLLHAGVLVMIVIKSIPVVQNLMSTHQAMNTSFDAFRIVNTYGAFGSVNKVRNEVVLQWGTIVKSDNPYVEWHDVEFKCKPGGVNKRPCLITPYHYRLDWLMWFAAFQNYQSAPWIVSLAVKLMSKDKDVLGLLDQNQMLVTIDAPVDVIRGKLYEYRYATDHRAYDANGVLVEDGQCTVGDEWEIGTWWRRKEIKEYLPAISLTDQSVVNFLKHHGFA